MDVLIFKWIGRLLLFLILTALPVFGYDYCYMYSYGYYNLYLGYCSDSCCGSYSYYRYCCYYSYYYSAYWGIGSIVGAVIGGIIALVVFVVVMIIICQQCNKRTTRGSVVQPNVQAATVTTVSHPPPMMGYSTAQPYNQPPPPQPQPGPVYGTDPAYPPSSSMYPPGPPQYTPASQPPPYKY